MICPIVLIRRKRRSRHRTFRRDPGRSRGRNRKQNHVCLIGDYTAALGITSGGDIVGQLRQCRCESWLFVERQGDNFLKSFEEGMRHQVGQNRSSNIKGFANIEIGWTAKGFEYAITAIKDKVTEFVAYLRGAAANQLDWDTKVLKSRSKQIEQPAQSRQREPKANSLGR
jgi:hypothetical protein